MTLLDLARRFDALPAEDIDARIPLAQQMDVLLGRRKEEFDDRYTALVESDPSQPGPALTALREMGLYSPTDAGPHPRGGPYPTLPPGYHARLAIVIQEARGRLHAGVEQMEIGTYIAAETFDHTFTRKDLRTAIAYLLKAAESKGRVDAIRDRKAAGIGWLALDLINDHNGLQERHLVGTVTAPDVVPRVVACYQPGQKGPACLNEIERAPALSEGKAPRLTRASVLTLSTDQLAALHEAGRVRHGNAWIRLVPQSETAEPAT